MGELNLLRAASQALRSYQYGNGSPELAESIADKIDAALAATPAADGAVVDALKFYAEPLNYLLASGSTTIVADDAGYRARTALQSRATPSGDDHG